MRFFIVAGVVGLTATFASAAWVVELDGGDKLTVDDYWEEGGRLHLVRGGVDLIVDKARLRKVEQGAEPLFALGPAPAAAAGSAEAAAPSGTAAEEVPAAPAAEPADPNAPLGTREELEAKQAAVEDRLLKAQQERFEATARGESEDTLKKLGAGFRHAQDERRDVKRALERLDAAQ